MTSKVQQLIRAYLRAGMRRENSADINHKIFMVNMFGLIGLSLTCVLGLNALYHKIWPLAAALLSASVLFYLCHAIQRRITHAMAHRISANMLLSCLVCLMLYLVYEGGANQTGPLWIYLVAPVAMFFGGIRNGLRDIGLFTLVVAIMMFAPNDMLLATSYTWEFKTRLLLSFMTVTFLSALYEFSRQGSLKRLESLSRRFEAQAKQDLLTGIANRRGMNETLQYEYARSRRSGQPMALLLCDLDYFKSINDNYGHDAGDQVLVEVSQRLRKQLRKQDVVARWGGEEFLIMLPETDKYQAYQLAEKLRKTLHSCAVDYEDKPISISISIGIADIHPEQGIEKAISQADGFLYAAKKQGRNCCMPVLSSNISKAG